MRRLTRLLRDQGGASAAEYAMILAIVGAAIAVAVMALGNAVSNSMNVSSQTIADCVDGC